MPVIRPSAAELGGQHPDDVGERRQLTEAAPVTLALSSDNVPSQCLDRWLKAVMVSFVAWKRRQLSERLAARLIGLFWFASAEWILCCWFSSRWFSSRKLREQLRADHMVRNSLYLWIPHGGYIVVGPVRIGRNCDIYQGVTLGEHEHPP